MSTFHHSAHFENHFGATDPTLNLVKCCKAGLHFKGDYHCDDENNNRGCGYDGGDCCGSKVYINYCSECKCKDPKCNPNNPNINNYDCSLFIHQNPIFL